MERIKKIWTWVKSRERVQGMIIILGIEFIILMVLYSIKCAL